MKKVNFTQSQITEILDEIANGKKGYQQLLQLSLESIMRAERNEFNAEHSDSYNIYEDTTPYNIYYFTGDNFRL